MNFKYKNLFLVFRINGILFLWENEFLILKMSW